MATTYTSNLRMGVPGPADRGWGDVVARDLAALDDCAPIAGLHAHPSEHPSASLDVAVSPGRWRKADGTAGAYAGGAIALPASSTRVLYLDPAGALTAAAAYPASWHVPIATATTTAAVVSAIVDDRVASQAIADPCLPLAGGTLAEGADVALGTSTGTKIGTATGQKLGFFGATPVVRPAAITQTYATATRTLAAYTADVESSTYTGQDNAQAGAVYAKLADLNALRAAVENLRVFAENTAQVLNALVDDHQAMGLAG